MGKLINIDNGGTLTDIWVLDGDKSYHTKTITTPYDLSKCFFDGLTKVSRIIYGHEDLPSLLHSTDHIRYSTTQGTNALVQKKGPRVGVLLERGTEDLLKKTSKEQEMFEALVGKRIATIDMSLTGKDFERSVNEAISELSSQGASRIVVSFHSGNYSEKESLLRKFIIRAYPSHLLGTVPVVYASELVGDGDFKRRTWSAVYNAFLHPAMELFLYHAESGLREARAKNPLLIFRNDGGSSRVAKTIALNTYSSGPRGGAEGLRVAADYYGMSHLLMMDVGGTTTDFAEVLNGAVRTLPKGEVEGVECAYPLCDIVSIGAGGGSIFRVRNGEVTIGPDSVGGAPGPACFGMGGQEATITDALLVLGLLDPTTYFGGEMKLDIKRADGVIRSNIAEPLGVSVESAVQHMIRAFARKLAQGVSEFTDINNETVLMGFGGGGPMNVLACAEEAGINTVLVPRLAAVYSAFGIGFSDISHVYRHIVSPDDDLKKLTDTMRARAAKDIFSEGFDIADCRIDLSVSADASDLALDIEQPAWPTSMESEQAELCMTVTKPILHAELPELTAVVASEAIPHSVRVLRLPEGEQEVAVYKVEEQLPGAQGQGPCVVEEDFFTCNILPGWSFEFTSNRDILIRKK